MNVLGGEYEDIITEWFKGVQFLTHEQLWEHLYQQVPEVSQEDRTLMMASSATAPALVWWSS